MLLPSQQHEDLALWLCLQEIPGLGSINLYKLLQAFGSPEAIFNSPQNSLKEIVSSSVATEISKLKSFTLDPTIANWLKDDHNFVITIANEEYPQLLLEISDPPPVLFAKGNLELLNTNSLAVVGSRNSSPQGEKNAEDFSTALCDHGITIVSGMALGIDAAAHRGALKSTGETIAVVGTGLDIVYPARHRDLAHKIVERGLIISEFNLGTPSRAQNFPRRNRIISGLSQGCLVIEANVQSGSLITARLAAEQGREVFAIPGSIHSPLSKGCHALIKQGAKLVDHIDDILHELNLNISQINNISNTEPNTQEINPLLELMGFDPINIETLINLSGLTSETLSAILMMLELESKIASLPGGRYQRIV